MNKEILSRLSEYNIKHMAVMPYRRCRPIKPRLLPFEPKSVILFLAPYYIELGGESNISLYAVSRDYHIFFRALYEDIEKSFPPKNVKGFADHSPIAEVEAAAAAGLGFFGDNGLLINEDCGSYVFIGEIFTDEDSPDPPPAEIRRCGGCGECKKACPLPGVCLSAVTQKKGELTEEEKRIILKNGSAWGCDTCQKVCPHNKGLKETPVEFFKKDLTPRLDVKTLEAMDDDEFKKRAYSWRGRDVIMRNLRLFEMPR